MSGTSVDGRDADFNRDRKADLALLNGKIWTGWETHRLSPRQEFAQSVAVTGGRIVAVGTDSEIQPLVGPQTELFDLEGRLALPGFIDCHVHLLEGGMQLLEIDLKDVETEAEFVERIAAQAKRLPPGEWLRGGNWDETRWPHGKLPTRWLIDPVTPRHPVFLRRTDGHAALVNSLALAVAGVTRQTLSPPGGEIVREAESGELTGLLKERAQELITRVMPPIQEEAAVQAIQAALKKAGQYGLTSIHNMDLGSGPWAAPSLYALPILQRALREGWLSCRIYEFLPLESSSSWLDQEMTGLNADNWLRWGGVKGFADGSLGSRTAWMDEGYADDTENPGLPMPLLAEVSTFEPLIRQAYSSGWQVALHAIGTRACHEVLNLIERVAGPSAPAARFRIEHAQHVRADDFARIARLGVIASMQPWHAIDDGRWAEERLGRDRAQYSYAWRSMLNVGAPLAFGSDWPVAPLNPLQGIYAAVTRATLDGRHSKGWIPQEKITLREALRAYTGGGAFAEFRENEKGAIAPGMLADLVVLSDDLFSIEAERIKDARVLLTIVNGRVVHRAGLKD